MESAGHGRGRKKMKSLEIGGIPRGIFPLFFPILLSCCSAKDFLLYGARAFSAEEFPAVWKSDASSLMLPEKSPEINVSDTFCNPQECFVGRIAFYNVENFFHPLHDSCKNDRDFTPTGIKGWGNARFTVKRNRLFKVVSALDAEVPLLALGLAEVENARVLRELCRGTPLRYRNFDFVHFESPDPRGIDVAFLFRTDLLEIDTACVLPVVVPPDTVSHTRDILYVKAAVKGSVSVRFPDTLHLFVNHFPSKYGGALATRHKRAYAARLLRSALDSVRRRSPGAFSLAMGDFNTDARDEVLHPLDSMPFCNLMARKEWDSDLDGQAVGGSHKYREKWSTIDHIILPSAFLHLVKDGKARLFDREFLLEADERYLGVKPFRTFYGARYLGGYSDHLPVYIDLIFQETVSFLGKADDSPP